MAATPRSRKSILRSHRLFLGVDGGGTKTHVVLTNESGTVKGDGLAGPSNPLRVGVETAAANIVKATVAACDNNGLSRGDIYAATLGLAGVRRADLRQRIRESVETRMGIRKIDVVTDAEIALYATTFGKPGLVVIAGTGSICIGTNSVGEIAISGGWGPLAGDEGGGVGIAQHALHAVAKASDGRGPATKLSESAAEYFRASGPENLIVAIYSPLVDNTRIAGFARFVVEAANEGDAVALEIVTNAGEELGIAAAAVIRRLELQQQKIPIGCVGSVFKAGGTLTAPMLAKIRAIAPKAFLTTPSVTPANAAAMMAISNFSDNKADDAADNRTGKRQHR